MNRKAYTVETTVKLRLKAPLPKDEDELNGAIINAFLTSAVQRRQELARFFRQLEQQWRPGKDLRP